MPGHIISGLNSDEAVETDRSRSSQRQRQPDGTQRKKLPTSGRISAIKQQVKTAGRFSIFVDGTYAFSLSESGLLEAKLHIGKELSATDLQDLQDTSKFDKAYGLTLAYIARRLRSEWELHDYFKRKKIEEEIAGQIIRRLKNYGYVDDHKFAESWVDNRRALKSVSRRRLIQELRQKRVPDDIIQQVLESDEVSDTDTLAALVLKKRQQSRYQDDTKLMQYLARQGYGYSDIKTALTGSDVDDQY